MIADPQETLAWVLWRDDNRRGSSSRRCTGISSDAMVAYALGRGPRPRTPGSFSSQGRHQWVGDECGSGDPADLWDLAACERTFAAAPEGLRDVLEPVMNEFRWWVLRGVNRHGDLLAVHERPSRWNHDQLDDVAPVWDDWTDRVSA